MFSFFTPRRTITIGAVVLSCFVMAACKEKTAPDPEPAVDFMRITVGFQSVNVDASTGVCTGCPLVLGNGAIVNVVFFESEGDPDPVVHDSEDFELTVTVGTNPTGMTFTPSQVNPFGGTFTTTSSTSTPFNVTFGLFHTGEQHTEFDWPVAVVVQ